MIFSEKSIFSKKAWSLFFLLSFCVLPFSVLAQQGEQNNLSQKIEEIERSIRRIRNVLWITKKKAEENSLKIETYSKGLTSLEMSIRDIARQITDIALELDNIKKSLESQNSMIFHERELSKIKLEMRVSHALLLFLILFVFNVSRKGKKRSSKYLF